MIQSNPTTYLSCAETAKLVRGALKKAFPGVKFSVKSSVYSGGASIHVKFAALPDAPSVQAVEAVAKQYQGDSFDGMTDSMGYLSHYLAADGSVLLRTAPVQYGTEGYDAKALDEVMVANEIKPVHFGANFVFVDSTCPACGWGVHGEFYTGPCTGGAK